MRRKYKWALKDLECRMEKEEKKYGPLIMAVDCLRTTINQLVAERDHPKEAAIIKSAKGLLYIAHREGWSGPIKIVQDMKKKKCND